MKKDDLAERSVLYLIYVLFVVLFQVCQVQYKLHQPQGLQQAQEGRSQREAKRRLCVSI